MYIFIFTLGYEMARAIQETKAVLKLTANMYHIIEDFNKRNSCAKAHRLLKFPEIIWNW
jgi:hypothetical protein